MQSDTRRHQEIRDEVADTLDIIEQWNAEDQTEVAEFIAAFPDVEERAALMQRVYAAAEQMMAFAIAVWPEEKTVPEDAP